MRRITLISIIMGIVLVIFTALLSYWFHPFFPHIAIGFFQAILTLVLIHYNYSRLPELEVLSFNIEPENSKGKIVAEEEFLKPVEGLHRPVVEPRFSRKFTKKTRYVKCKSKPSFIRVAFDITNVGLTGVMVHEFRYKELKPNQSHEFIKPICEEGNGKYHYKPLGIKRIYVRPQERITLDFRYPRNNTPLEDGRYEFLVTIYAATMRIKKILPVEISSNLKTISWTWR